MKININPDKEFVNDMRKALKDNIVLKLIGVIDWNWWWVLSPVWIPVIIVVIAYIVISIVD